MYSQTDVSRNGLRNSCPTYSSKYSKTIEFVTGTDRVTKTNTAPQIKAVIDTDVVTETDAVTVIGTVRETDTVTVTGVDQYSHTDGIVRGTDMVTGATIGTGADTGI